MLIALTGGKHTRRPHAGRGFCWRTACNTGAPLDTPCTFTTTGAGLTYQRWPPDQRRGCTAIQVNTQSPQLYMHQLLCLPLRQHVVRSSPPPPSAYLQNANSAEDTDSTTRKESEEADMTPAEVLTGVPGTASVGASLWAWGFGPTVWLLLALQAVHWRGALLPAQGCCFEEVMTLCAHTSPCCAVVCASSVCCCWCVCV